MASPGVVGSPNENASSGVLMTSFSRLLSPVVSAMERRLRWSRRLSSAVLLLAIVIVLGTVVLAVTQAIVDAVREFSDDLPRIVEEFKQSDLGSLITAGAARSTHWRSTRATSRAEWPECRAASPMSASRLSAAWPSSSR